MIALLILQDGYTSDIRTKEAVPMETLKSTEAQRLFKVNGSTIRRWAAEGRIKAEKNSEGVWLINKNSLQAALATGTTKQARAAKKANIEKSSAHNSLQSSPALERILDREQKINDELRLENKKLQGEILKLTHEMQALLKREDKGLLSRWLRS